MAHNFSTEYDAAADTLKKKKFDPSWDKLIGELKTLMGTGGFEDNSAASLDTLRKEVKPKGRKSKGKAGEDVGILTGTGEYKEEKDGKTYNKTADLVKKAATLKLLRHTYLLQRRGSQKLWIISLPKAYRGWPSLELDGLENNQDTLCTKLSDCDEYFSKKNCKNIADGTQEALKWCMKTQVILANAKSDKDKGKGKELVKRWFADDSTTDEQVGDMVTKLTSGFKKITNVLNSNKIVYSDYPPDRGTNDEIGTEAFVFNNGWKDKLDVVYIEQAFFGKNNVLTGLDNWARIIIHEISHREIPTVDVPDGYGWQGINPTDGKFAGGKAITNAENWAFFAADCAKALSKSERNKALKT